MERPIKQNADRAEQRGDCPNTKQRYEKTQEILSQDSWTKQTWLQMASQTFTPLLQDVMSLYILWFSLSLSL